MQITTIGLDIAKNMFQVHGIDANEKVVVRKQLRRSQLIAFFKALPPCLVGMEACASAHYWARELRKFGHEVRLMPAKDVKAYVKRNKNDAVDAEASCEAVRRPTMRFVGVKSAEQQGRLMQHRTRDLLMRQQTQGGPMRYKPKSTAAPGIALGGLPNKMRVELDEGVGVSAKTVGEL